VFAITLAIIAGLIFAWVFKKVLLDKGPKPAATVEPTYRLTVAATNIYDGQPVKQIQLKKITVTKKQWDEAKEEEKRHGKSSLLEGNQAVGRVAKEALKAEKPMYEDQLEPFKYPVAVPSLVEVGKRAVIVPVATENAMVQVGDHVDVVCTMSNAAFGKGRNASAVMARDAKCVARFNSTRTGVEPPRRGKTRTFTLEVTPYRYALIELAKSMGAQFSLSSRGSKGEQSSSPGAVTPVGGSPAPSQDPDVDRVTSQDLAKLFGITDPVPERVFVIDRYNGLKQKPSLQYHDPRPLEVPPAPLPGKPSGVSQSNVDSSDKVGQRDVWQPIGSMALASSGGRNRNGNAAASDSTGQPDVWRRLGNGPLMASAGRVGGGNGGGNGGGAGNIGFGAPINPDKSCKT
jgi:Flp pilus assembly protein CpaB